MYWVILLIIILWLLGVLNNIASGFIHLLLVVALIVLIVKIIQDNPGRL